MTYDHELKLIQQQGPAKSLDSNVSLESDVLLGLADTIVTNEIGDPMPIESETVVLCGLKSIGRNEFYQAAANGLRPDIVFVMHGYEYSDEKTVEFEGNRYNVIRTYATSFEEVELVCSGLVNGVT